MGDNNNEKKPENKISLGLLNITTWKNTNEKGDEYLNYTFQKSFKNKSGEWESSKIILNVSDLDKFQTLISEIKRKKIKEN
jgi:hypothetical protein